MALKLQEIAHFLILSIFLFLFVSLRPILVITIKYTEKGYVPGYT